MKAARFLPPWLIIFIISLLIRILYNITAGNGYIAQFDAEEYQKIAMNILNNHCFCIVPGISTTARPPLWPAIIAIIYGIFGPNNLSVRMFLSILGAATCIIVYLFARELFGKRYGIAAGIVAAFYSGLFLYDGWLYSEALYTFFFFGFAYTLYRFQQTSQIKWAIMSGIALGLSILTRQNGLFTIAMLAVFAVVVGWQGLMPWRTIIKGTFGITIISILMVAPWTIRNYAVSHYFIPVATGSSTILAGAYNDTVFTNPFLGATGTWVPPDAAQPPIPNTKKCCTFFGEDPNQQDYAYTWMETHLHSLPRLFFMHFMNLWGTVPSDGALPISQFPDRPVSQIIIQSMKVIPRLMYILCAFAVITTWKHKRQQLLTIYLGIILTVIQAITFYGSVRFRAPIEPMLVILAIGGVWGLVRLLADKLFKKRLALA